MKKQAVRRAIRDGMIMGGNKGNSRACLGRVWRLEGLGEGICATGLAEGKLGN